MENRTNPWLSPSKRDQAEAGNSGCCHYSEDLKHPPGNRLEKLHGDRQGQYSIRINDQYRICFVWRGHDVFEVEITDYH
jgi:proteic killer suppression protein